MVQALITLVLIIVGVWLEFVSIRNDIRLSYSLSTEAEILSHKHSHN